MVIRAGNWEGEARQCPGCLTIYLSYEPRLLHMKRLACKPVEECLCTDITGKDVSYKTIKVYVTVKKI